jgi:hypothetical protein
VYINGVLADRGSFAGPRTIDKIALGLSGSQAYGFNRLYSVKVGLPGAATTGPGKTTEIQPNQSETNEPPDENIKVAPPASGKVESNNAVVETADRIAESFNTIKEGQLPEDWISKGDRLGVVKVGERKALVLSEPAGVQSMLRLPKLPLKGDFYLECEYLLPEQNATLVFHLQKGGEPLLRLVVRGDGKLLLQNQIPGDASSALRDAGETNRLRLERSGEVYWIKVNGKVVGRIPAQVAAGPFEAAAIGLAVGSDGASPQIFAFQLVPTGKDKED